MYLENLVFDAIDPNSLGRFWEAALGTETLTDNEHGYETRLTVPGGPVLDLCFQPVPEPPADPQRLHLDVRGGEAQEQVVDRLLASGADPADVGQGEVPWTVLADPEGNPFCVLEDRPVYTGTGPIAALPLDVADPERERDFWRWLTGWEPVDHQVPSLRHPSGRGPVLEMCAEVAPKGPEKNRLHLDLRLESDDDIEAVVTGIVERGGRELHFDWGDLPWRHFADPSGNEFCILAAYS